ASGLPRNSSGLSLDRGPYADAERVHDELDGEGSEDDSHDADEYGRAVLPDDPQDRLGQKKHDVVKKQNEEENGGGLRLLQRRVDVVVGQDDDGHDRSRTGDRGNGDRKDGEVVARLRSARLRVVPAEQHLKREDEEDQASRELEGEKVD